MYFTQRQSYAEEQTRYSFPSGLPEGPVAINPPSYRDRDGTFAPDDIYTSALLEGAGGVLYADGKGAKINVVVVPKGGGRPVKTTSKSIPGAFRIFNILKKATVISGKKKPA